MITIRIKDVWRLAIAPLIAAFAFSTPAAAERMEENGVVAYAAEGTVEDVAVDVENEIVNRGLVIDYRSYVGQMLARTREDVGSDIELFEDAQIFVFCSAVLSRRLMENGAMMMGFCPWGVFVFSKAGAPEQSFIGYRRLAGDDTPEDDPRHEIDAMLDAIASSAAEGL